MQDTVLVVEDEADMVDLLRYNLSKAGFCVLIAGDGITALEIARKNRPDVVILDLLLAILYVGQSNQLRRIWTIGN